MEEIPHATPKLHLFVCINESSCSPTITADHVREVKQWIVQNGLTTTVYCTKAKCLGFCNPDGGVAVIYPKGKFYKGIKTTEELKQIILQEL